MTFVPYEKLTGRQKKDARWLRPNWQDREFENVLFRVMDDGALSGEVVSDPDKLPKAPIIRKHKQQTGETS